MKKQIFVLITMAELLLCFISVLFAQKIVHEKLLNYYGTYSTSYGNVQIRRSKQKRKIKFSILVSHGNGSGCGGDFSNEAKLIKGNVFQFDEKVGQELSYEENTVYHLKFVFSKNRVLVKETANGDKNAVNMYHGNACTFDGVYFKR